MVEGFIAVCVNTFGPRGCKAQPSDIQSRDKEINSRIQVQTELKKADRQRMEAIKGQGQDNGALPCLPCILVVNRVRMPSVQHVVEGRKRLGHQMSYASCEWHHFGKVVEGRSRQEMSGLLGPSLAHGKRGFQEFFGPERFLIEIQNLILRHFNASPWFDYQVPDLVRVAAQHLWAEKR